MKWPIPLWNYSINCNLEHLSTSGPWAFKKIWNWNLKISKKLAGIFSLPQSSSHNEWISSLLWKSNMSLNYTSTYIHIYIYLVLNSDPKEIHRGKKHWNGNPKDKIQTYCLTIALWTLAISKAAGFRSCQLCPEGPIHTQNHSNIRVKHEYNIHY